MSVKCSVLLVEDDVAIREGLSHILRAEQYGVFGASSLSEAVAAYNSNEVGLVLLDLHLGDENGWDVFRTLKSINPGLPIVVTSAQPDLLSDSSTFHPCGLLEKPFEISQLLALLAAVLHAHSNGHADSGADMDIPKRCSCPQLRGTATVKPRRLSRVRALQAGE
jgi:DNA-binding response OmpR family regulator